MLDHLRSKGYPKLTTEQILAELKPMWIKLEEAKLTLPSWRYARFVEIAQLMARASQVKGFDAEVFRQFMRGRKR